MRIATACRASRCRARRCGRSNWATLITQEAASQVDAADCGSFEAWDDALEPYAGNLARPDIRVLTASNDSGVPCEQLVRLAVDSSAVFDVR